MDTEEYLAAIAADTSKSPAERLSIWMGHQGMTQACAAGLFHLSRPTVGAALAGSLRLRYSSYEKIKDVTGIGDWPSPGPHTLRNSEHKRRHRARFPERERARNAAARALASGVLIKRACEANGCGAEDVEMHHADYARPLEVQFFCRRHHVEAEAGRPPRGRGPYTVQNKNPGREYAPRGEPVDLLGIVVSDEARPPGDRLALYGRIRGLSMKALGEVIGISAATVTQSVQGIWKKRSTLALIEKQPGIPAADWPWW